MCEGRKKGGRVSEVCSRALRDEVTCWKLNNRESGNLISLCVQKGRKELRLFKLQINMPCHASLLSSIISWPKTIQLRASALHCHSRAKRVAAHPRNCAISGAFPNNIVILLRNLYTTLLSLLLSLSLLSSEHLPFPERPGPANPKSMDYGDDNSSNLSGRRRRRKLSCLCSLV